MPKKSEEFSRAELIALRQELEQYREGRVLLAQHSHEFVADHYLGWKLYDHQRKWADHLKSSRRGAVIAPTGHGKTIIAGQLLPLQNILIDRNHRNLIISASWSLARDNVQVISTHLRENKKLKADFGSFYSPHRTWGKTEIYVDREQVHKDASVKAVSIMAEFTGSKYHTIIFDDCITERNAREPEQRKKIKDFIYGTVMHRLESGGTIWVIGTRKNYADWYSEIIDSIQWDVLVDRAVIRYPDEYEIVELDEENWILREDGTFQKVAVDISGDPGEVLCPDLFSMESLLLERHENRIMFDRERQQTISTSDDDLFKAEDLEAAKDAGLSYVDSVDELPDHEYAFFIAGTDPAIVTDERTAKKNETSYMVTFVFGVYPNGNVDVLHMFKKRGFRTKEKVDKTKQISANFGVLAHYWEANAFGSLNIETFREDTDVPIRPHWTGKNKTDMYAGIPSLSILFENGKIKLPYKTPKDREITNEIISELLAVGKAVDVKSDVVMSMWIANCGKDKCLRQRDRMVAAERHAPDRDSV